MNLSLRALFFTCLMLVFMQPVQANQDFYRINLSINNEASNADGFKQGLITLLKKMTPMESYPQSAIIQQALEQPQQYIKRYAYHKQGSNKLLTVMFDPKEVRALLRRAGIEGWSDTTQTVLAWVSYQDENSATIVEDDASKTAVMLKKTASQLGLRLVLPAMDLTDTTSISPATLFNHQALKQASHRYQIEHILSIRLRQNEHTIESNWSLLSIDGDNSNWFVEDEPLKTVLTQGFEQLKQRLNPPIQAATMRVEITNIDSEQAYQQLLDHFKHLKGVNTVELDSVTADSVLYTLETTVPLAKMNRILTQDAWLKFERNAEGTYYYRLTHETKTHS